MLFKNFDKFSPVLHFSTLKLLLFTCRKSLRCFSAHILKLCVFSQKCAWKTQNADQKLSLPAANTNWYICTFRTMFTNHLFSLFRRTHQFFIIQEHVHDPPVFHYSGTCSWPTSFSLFRNMFLTHLFSLFRRIHQFFIIQEHVHDLPVFIIQQHVHDPPVFHYSGEPTSFSLFRNMFMTYQFSLFRNMCMTHLFSLFRNMFMTHLLSLFRNIFMTHLLSLFRKMFMAHQFAPFRNMFMTHLFSSFRNMFFSSSLRGLSDELILVSSHFSRSSMMGLVSSYSN